MAANTTATNRMTAKTPPERHLLKHLGQRDEQKRRPRGHVQPEGEHRRHHHARGHEPRDGVEDGDVLRRVHHVHVSLQVAAVHQRAAAGQRQAEECLAERVHPGSGIQQRLPAGHEQVQIARFRPRQRGHADGDDDEQHEEGGHEHLVRLLDAPGHAEDHDAEGDGQPQQVETHVTEVRRHGSEEGARIGLGHKLAGHRREQVMASPAQHHGIPDGQGERPQRGN